MKVTFKSDEDFLWRQNVMAGEKVETKLIQTFTRNYSF